MAKKENEIISLLSEDQEVARPRLSKLIIKNFRSIRENPVEIDLDEIVVLVGANNAGKSSILRAYEVVMSHGAKEGKLVLDDFPNKEVNSQALPEIEVHTIISENKPGDQWIKHLENGEMLIREKWTWYSVGTDPKRQGYDVQKQEWSDKVPWGAPNVANAYRPKPHRIDAFSSPEEQANAISTLLSDIIKDKVKKIKSPYNKSDKTDYELLIEQIATFQKNVLDSTQTEIKEIEESISSFLGKVFLNYTIALDAKPETNIEKTYTPFKEAPDILMGPKGGYMASVSSQGSGVRRTLMWTALKYLQEHADSQNSRPHVLLLDEPEVCLHPSAIRDARKVLYELPKNRNWQVMITTHSPIFIDLSYDNTTIIRVDKNENEQVSSTTLYRPQYARLSDDDKENLKLLNVCDPYMHEFFFGGRVVIVEGDTEYTAFSLLKMLYPQEYDDVHVIRARGKAIIPSVSKVLNQFSCYYAILHDADTELSNNGNKNPAWAINENILRQAEASKVPINIIACQKNFEDALFSANVSSDKPYNTLMIMKTDVDLQNKVKQLFDALLDASLQPPEKCVRWKKIEDLK